MLRFDVLGTISLRDSDRGELHSILQQPKRLALFAYLVAQRSPVSRDTLLGLLWPDVSMDRPRAILNQSLYVLRSTLGTGVVRSLGKGEVSVDTSAIGCDLVEFHAALSAVDWDTASAAYAEPLLPGSTYPAVLHSSRGSRRRGLGFDATRSRLR